MKRRVVFLCIIVTICLLSGCSSTDSGSILVSNSGENDLSKDFIDIMAEKLFIDYFPVFIHFKYEANALFNKDKELTIYIDGEKIDVLEQGDSPSYALILKSGEHTLSVASSIINTDKEIFSVGEIRGISDAPNIFSVKLRFKQGDAEIESISSGEDTSYMNMNDKIFQYAEALQILLTNYKGIGDYDEVITRYMQINEIEETMLCN